MLFKCDTDQLLIMGPYLRIRYDGRKKQCMSPAAFGTSDATDAKTEGAFRKLYASVIVTMDGHACRMATSTGYLMKLNTINDRIIKGLRNMVAILGKNGYHSNVSRHGVIHACG